MNRCCYFDNIASVHALLDSSVASATSVASAASSAASKTSAAEYMRLDKLDALIETIGRQVASVDKDKHFDPHNRKCCKHQKRFVVPLDPYGRTVDPFVDAAGLVAVVVEDLVDDGTVVVDEIYHMEEVCVVEGVEGADDKELLDKAVVGLCQYHWTDFENFDLVADFENENYDLVAAVACCFGQLLVLCDFDCSVDLPGYSLLREEACPVLYAGLLSDEYGKPLERCFESP